MQASDDMKFGDRFRVAFSSLVPDLFERQRVSFGISYAFAERAQTATCHADIRRVDVPVHIEVRDFSMQTFARDVRHVSEPQNIGAPKQCDTVIESQPLAAFYL